MQFKLSYAAMVNLFLFGGLALGKQSLPIQGKFFGNSQCMEKQAATIDPALNEKLTISMHNLIIENEYEGNDQIKRKNIMEAVYDSKAGLTSESPDFIQGLAGLKVLSSMGKSMFKKLAQALQKRPHGIDTYTLKPSEDVVNGKMFCDDKEKWCHFEAVKRVKIPNPSNPQGEPLVFEVHGGDMTAQFGNDVLRVGYAFDKVSCAPNVCVYVCEAQLKRAP